jgi:hypothetical protein
MRHTLLEVRDDAAGVVDTVELRTRSPQATRPPSAPPSPPPRMTP